MHPLEAFLAHMGPLTWDDLVVGYDFGFLAPWDIQAEASGHGAAVQNLRSLQGEALVTFEASLWAACKEATGRLPRPGHAGWERSQDRWREALLLELLAQPMSESELAARIERLYEQVGCPEDMLGMFQPAQIWSRSPALVDLAATFAFLARLSARRQGSLPAAG